MSFVNLITVHFKTKEMKPDDIIIMGNITDPLLLHSATKTKAGFSFVNLYNIVVALQQQGFIIDMYFP